MAFVKIKDGQALQRFLSDPDVVAVYENVAHEATLPQSLALINQPIAQSFGKTGRGTMVAVLDTGLDWTQPGFDGVTPGWGCSAVGGSCKVRVAIDFAPNDGVRDDFSMHGTNVAGIVAGVAPQTYFAALDVFSGSTAQAAHVLAAINWVVQNARPHNIVAMNLSFGGNVGHSAECSSSYIASAFQNARSAGVIPVVASGNNGFLSGISEPACAPGAVRVGAVYDSNFGSYSGSCSDATTAADKVTCFSNSASFLTLLAPGAMITAAGVTKGGTSQAAPHVAGAVAVLRASNGFPGDTLDNTVGRMVNSGVQVRDHRNGIIKPRLNLGRALGLN
ncbi:MAG: S8 family serine peptidase [Gammaproteobacteria bacterium]